MTENDINNEFLFRAVSIECNKTKTRVITCTKPTWALVKTM